MSKPSEKAILAAADFSRETAGGKCLQAYPQGQWGVSIEALAERIDAHTAEALSEHKRVLELAWHALNHSLQCDMETKSERQPALDAMAAIAELKTNEKPNA